MKRAVLEFTEMMELLIESGLSLKDGLEVLTKVALKAEAGQLGRRLSEYIGKGASFAQAVGSMDDTFPSIYRGMIRVGDRVGSVERIFPRLGAYLRDQKKLRDKIYGALAYPALVLAVAVLGSIGLGFFVIPKMEGIFAGFGGDAAGRISANMEGIKTGLFCFSILMGFIIIGVVLLQGPLRSNKKVRTLLDYRLLQIPALGGFLRSWESLNFSFAMEVLTGGGISLETALVEAAAVVSNHAYRSSLLRVRQRILSGGSLSRSFSEDPLFPPYMSQWISIGERSGKTEKVFSQLRVYFQDEIERRTSTFLLLIEPALIVLIGVFILGLVIGIILPLFSMYGTLL